MSDMTRDQIKRFISQSGMTFHLGMPYERVLYELTRFAEVVARHEASAPVEWVGFDDTPQTMTMGEREHLKASHFGDQAPHVITMIAHWHRQRVSVGFTQYASNWAVAQKERSVSEIAKAWPLLVGPRMIEDGCTDWGSYGDPRYAHHRGKA